MSEATQQLLAHAARRAAARPWFIAHVLDAYLAALGGEDEDLAATLDVSARTVSRLRLCRRLSEGRNEGVVAIAEGLGIDASRLANLLNAAEAALAVKDGAPRVSSALLAARHREPQDETEGDGHT
ncbi:MAG: hypothetical protein OXC94_03525 [Chloroflexi bacterium]|nr:hypothetical protein [Chloroflexota bacterium]